MTQGLPGATSIGSPNQPFYGVGPATPWQLDQTKSRVLVISNEQLIRASMDTIINTDVNERPFLVKNGQPFGTLIKRALFSPSSIAASIISYEIPRALNLWEPRIIVQGTKCSVSKQPSGVMIIANTLFRFRSTNRADNFVSPFLLMSPDQT